MQECEPFLHGRQQQCGGELSCWGGELLLVLTVVQPPLPPKPRNPLNKPNMRLRPTPPSPAPSAVHHPPQQRVGLGAAV